LEQGITAYVKSSITALTYSLHPLVLGTIPAK